MVPTTESPKVIGLMCIHNPNALQHYAGYTYCPWCGKEGQNEGTVVNHLRTTHYRARSCVWPVFWLPISNIRLTLLAWMPKLSMILCHFWIRFVQLTHLPNQEFIQRSKGGAIQLYPLPSGRPRDLMEKATTHQPAKIHLSFSSLTDKTAISIPRWPELLKKDAADSIKHTHPNWLKLRRCSQELIKTTTAND